LGQVRDGAVVIAFFVPSQAAIVVGEGVFRVEPDRVREVGNGAIAIALDLPGEAAAHIGVGAGLGFLGAVLRDDRAARDIAIRIVGVAVVMVLVTGGECRRRNRHEHAGDQHRGRQAHVVSPEVGANARRMAAGRQGHLGTGAPRNSRLVATHR
jgi:hypothetical protein